MNFFHYFLVLVWSGDSITDTMGDLQFFPPNLLSFKRVSFDICDPKMLTSYLKIQKHRFTTMPKVILFSCIIEIYNLLNHCCDLIITTNSVGYKFRFCLAIFGWHVLGITHYKNTVKLCYMFTFEKSQLTE